MYQFYRIAYNTYTIIDSTFYSFILYIVYTFRWEKRREQKGVYVIADNIGMAEVSYIRNPYPLPDLYPREGVWTKKPVLGSKVSPNDLEWSRKLNVYERLFAHHTLTSIRKDCRLQRKEVIENYSSKYIYIERSLWFNYYTLFRRKIRTIFEWTLQVPEDSLDLALSTVYIHSKDTLVPKSYIPVQPETLGKKTWRVLKNKVEVI